MFKKLVFLGSDHGGFDLKEAIKVFLDSKNFDYKDMGTFDKKSVNYVDYAKAVSMQVVEHEAYGVLCCSSGIGVSIVANKIPGVRAALCTNSFHAEFARRHNNANVICFGQKVTPPDDVLNMLDIFLNTEFDGGRHQIRVDSISEIEKNFYRGE